MALSETMERGVKVLPFKGSNSFLSFIKNKCLNRKKDGKIERKIIRTWVSGLSNFLEIFTPVIASGMCQLPVLI